MYIWSPVCRPLHTTYGVSGRLPAGCLYTPCRWCGGPLLACVVQAEGEDRETPRPVGGSGKSGVGLQRGYRGIPTPAKLLQRNECRYLPRRCLPPASSGRQYTVSCCMRRERGHRGVGENKGYCILKCCVGNSKSGGKGSGASQAKQAHRRNQIRTWRSV